MGTNNVDHSSNTRPEMAQPLEESLGYQAATNPIWDLENAGCILTMGTNATEEHNVAAVPVKRAVRNGAKLIVIDPREVELTRYATMWVRPLPGTDAVLVGGMLRVIMDEVLEDEDFLRDSCEDVDALKNSLWRFDLKKVAEATGISEEEIREVARTFAQNGPAAILYALDTVAASSRVDLVKALSNLALMTGNIGKPHAGLYPLRPGTNDQGSWDVGCVPGLLPGYRSLDDPAGFREAWGAELPSGPGLGINEVFQAAADGRVKAMMVVGDSPNFANGQLGDAVQAASNLDFLVVQDTFLSEMAQAADVVLPSVTFAEKEGTFTNLERRVQPLRKVLEVGNTQAMPDWWTLSQIAQAMNAQGFDYHCTAQILDEISRVVPMYAGISYQRLLSRESVLQPAGMPSYPIPSQLLPTEGGQNFGVQWPSASPDDPGVDILYAQGAHDRRHKLLPMELKDEPAMTTPDYPFLFLPGRVLQQPQRGIEIEVVGEKNRIQRDEIIEIHPSDAAALGIGEGEWVEAASARDSVRAMAHVSEATTPGTVSVTYIFGELATRLEESDDPDPMSKVPTLDMTP